ncbi:MAG: UDP-N-acetylglucosamine 2-epimerase (non-hydrolyzing) [Bacteroidia bacterium]
MLNILTIIGARPQIIKAAALSRAVRSQFSDSIRESILHTGQHYDENMSGVFFEELNIPRPDFRLHVGSALQGEQTGAMISGIEKVLIEKPADAVVVYGDTNSTLAGAIAASKMNIPVVHIEAGLRSFNKAMPEEINRILTDHVSTLLFTPTHAGWQHLKREGIAREKNPDKADANHPAVYLCGDIMYDNALHFSEIAAKHSGITELHQLKSNAFILATVHRNTNTDDTTRLKDLFEAFTLVSHKLGMKIIIPLHPRTAARLKASGISVSENHFIIIPPVSYLDMIQLEQQAAFIMTDSGGVQKEAFFFNKPCVILRDETEWVEIVDCGAAALAGTSPEKIVSSAEKMMHHSGQFPSLFGDGRAALFICQTMINHFAS